MKPVESYFRFRRGSREDDKVRKKVSESTGKMDNASAEKKDKARVRGEGDKNAYP